MAKRKAQPAETPTADKPAEEIAPPSKDAASSPPAAESGQRAIPDPFAIATDYTVGVSLLESRRYRQMQLKFNEKPSQPIIDAVKAGGYQWNSQDRVWTRQINRNNAMETRIDAERLFKHASAALRQEKGIKERS
jgi:hypothetical protein